MSVADEDRPRAYVNPLDAVDDDSEPAIQPGAVVLADEAEEESNFFTAPTGVMAWWFWPKLDESEARDWAKITASGAARGILHPDSNFRKYWDVFSMVLIIYSCVTIPYRLGFKQEAEGMYVALDRIVDALFMVDICFTFRTAIYIEQHICVETGVIGKEYAKGWLVPDFFSSFPFDMLLNASGSTDNPDAARVLKMIRVFRMLKILRMVRIKRLLKKFQDEMSIKNGVMISIKFSIVVIMASHFLACLWFHQSYGDSQNNWAKSYCVWADKDSYNEGCSGDVCRVLSCEIGCGGSSRDTINKANLEIIEVKASAAVEKCLEECVKCNADVQYTAAIYYALVTMTTIGYGDVLPTNDSERMFATVAMLIGASIFAYAITNMCTVVHNLNPGEVFTKGRMDDLTDLISFLKLNRIMRHKIMEVFFFKANGSTTTHHNEESILGDMSLEMRRAVRLFTVRRSIEAVPFFCKYDIKSDNQDHAALSRRLLGMLACCLESGPYAPGDKIVQQGTEALAMHMMVGGAAEIRQNSVMIASCGDGCCLATTALFRKCQHMYTAIVKEYSDVFTLKRSDFRHCMKECGESVIELEIFAVESGLTASDIADFTVQEGHQRWKPYTDPRSDAELEAARKLGISELQRRIKLQERYIELLTASIAGMS